MAPLLSEALSAGSDLFFFVLIKIQTVVVPFLTHYLGLAFVASAQLVHSALSASFALVTLAFSGGDANADGKADVDDVTAAAGTFAATMQAKIAGVVAVAGSTGSQIAKSVLAPLGSDGTPVKKVLFALFAYYCFAQVADGFVSRFLKGKAGKIAHHIIWTYPFIAVVCFPEYTPELFRAHGLDEKLFASNATTYAARFEKFLPFVSLFIATNFLVALLTPAPAAAKTTAAKTAKATPKAPAVSKSKKRR